MKKYIKEFLGDNPIENSDYPKIINERHFERIVKLLENENIIIGGKASKDLLKIEPTLVNNLKLESPIMTEEIFGPILPIISFEKIEEIVQIINQKEKPLALYLFTNNKKVEEKILKDISFGGGCINDTIMHLASETLPFGGVGNSGIGAYHGKYGFDTFTHYKSILKKSNLIDMPMRYHKYTDKKMKLVKKFLK